VSTREAIRAVKAGCGGRSRTAGKDLVAKVGDKVNGFGKTSITGRAKAAAKKAGYEGEDAKMFVDGYVEAVQAAKGK
jgi:hypothetical protein